MISISQPFCFLSFVLGQPGVPEEYHTDPSCGGRGGVLAGDPPPSAGVRVPHRHHCRALPAEDGAQKAEQHFLPISLPSPTLGTCGSALSNMLLARAHTAWCRSDSCPQRGKENHTHQLEEPATGPRADNWLDCRTCPPTKAFQGTTTTTTTQGNSPAVWYHSISGKCLG